MLKLIFVLLLAANAALFAYGAGYLGQFSGNEHEPARLQQQHNADKLQLISASQAESAAAAVAPPPPPAPVPRDEPAAVACLEAGNFPQAEARKFEDRLAALQLGDRQQRRNLPDQEISSYIVHIPPQASRAAAEKKADELRELGITNFFILNESSPLKWGISLGVFRSEAAAQSQLATLHKQGVQTARVAPRYTGSKQMVYQFRDISEDTKARIAKIVAKFPEQETRACSSAR
ncbi:SPOR domain-containing protein [Pseudoduganella violaceinigra]|uniref:SPOR domain-containing protein n=1 Tax=Pseudoduganella violaceinigra TaxID=246602 RepID=UPI0003F53EBF|nr:SPOR domain-containing protein [Pseudoduganella violaceinigra]